jgi:eukaryotic-like serine/threonine-protein kinase
MQAPPKHVVRGQEQLAWALALAFLIAAIVSVVSYTRLARAPALTIISEIPPPEKTHFKFAGESGGPPVLSPDGRALAFSAVDASGKTMLWIRSLDSTSARFLPGTEGAASPFWSADSRALGFFANDKLKSIEASGGPALVVADAPAAGGGSWSREGTILFVPDYQKGLYQVAASGGTPVRVLEADASRDLYLATAYSWPKFLPDGRHFLYYAGALDPAASGAVYFGSMDGKENRLLLKVNGSATYASGLLLYVRGTTLMAQSFDPERGQLKGDARPVAERIAGDVGRDFFDASENGVLVYEVGESVDEKRLTWFDRGGKDSGATGEAAAYYDVRLSPDGKNLRPAKVTRPVTSGWTNFRGVCGCASRSIQALTMALRSGRPTEAGCCSVTSEARRRWAFTRSLPTEQAARSCCCRQRPPIREYGLRAGLATANSSSTHEETWST